MLVVGSGFGGGTTAYALSRAGLKVLLVERGGWPARDETDWNGRAILLEGRYKGETPVDVRQGGAGADVETFPNEVVGGNSIFFGGAALRLRATDFARWPIAYADLEAHYGEAEALLEVHGQAGDDPCEPPRSSPYPYPPAELTAPARRIADAARALGLHPFHIPVAINHAGTREPRCINCFTCDGFPCRIGAKNDVTQTALAKADPNNLAVVARMLVARLVERDGRIAGVEAIDRDSGRRLTLQARATVLSGGAIGSAALMLRSGLGARDASGTLGRFLMRHCNAMIGYVFPFRTNPDGVNHKQICVTDLYESVRDADGTSLGIIQDMVMPPREVVRALGPPGFRWAAGLGANSIQTLLCIAEDEPQKENGVSLSERNGRVRPARRGRPPRVHRGGRPPARRAGAGGAPDPAARGRTGRQAAPDRQLLARGRNGEVRAHAGRGRAVAGVSRVGVAEPVRGRRQLHADVGRREPEPHDHGERVSRGGARATRVRRDRGAPDPSP